MALLAGLLAVVAAAARELTLAECVGLALENNLDLKIEKLAREIAGRDVGLAQGGYDPNLKIAAKRTHEETAGESAGTAAGALAATASETDGATYEASLGGTTGLAGLQYEFGARTGASDGTRNGNPFDTSTGSASLTLTQPLLKGFKTDSTRYQVVVARGQSAEARVQLEARAQSVLGEVEAAWYALIAARESIRAQEEAVRLAQQSYEDNRRKVQIGALAALDEMQAGSQAAAARAELRAAQQTYAEAQNRLKTLLYADHRSVRGVAIAAAGELSAADVAVDAAASGERALANRPDLRQARLALARQGLEVVYQQNQILPALDLVGGYGVAAADEESRSAVFDRLAAADEPFWSAGVALTLPLGNRAAKHRYARSLATAAKQKLELRKLEEAALVEVDDAGHAVASARERAAAMREAREYAAEALAAEQRKLDSGNSTAFVVLQLQRDLTSARKSEIAALADYNRALSALALAEGAMLERHGVDLAEE